MSYSIVKSAIGLKKKLYFFKQVNFCSFLNIFFPSDSKVLAILENVSRVGIKREILSTNMTLCVNKKLIERFRND